MLENTLWKLTHATEFTVVYFGGSITEGAGVSDPEKCWANRTTAYLKEKFPRCRIKAVQAAIGGTDSTLGAFRCERDVCAHKPDLVFFEFAVNDSFLDYETALKNAEACFLKIFHSAPTADVVTVYTTTKTLSTLMAEGGVWHAKLAHGAVSEHYDVPQIDVGEALRTRALSEGDAWLSYTTDGCHPNEAGYALCASVLQKQLEKLLAEAKNLPAPEAKRLPPPLVEYEKSHLRARVVDCLEAAADAKWTLKEQSLCRRYPRYIECAEPGGCLTFTFTGSRVDLYWMMAPDSGDALCSVDGGDEVLLSAWDSYCKRFSRANAACVAKNLPEGEHTLKIRVSPAHNPESAGTTLRIGAFLVL